MSKLVTKGKQASTILVLSLAFCGIYPSAAASPTRLTPELALETTRLVYNRREIDALNPNGAVSVSPNGLRYVARLVRGDVAANGVWIEIVTGELQSLARAEQVKLAARLFTSGKGAAWLFGPDHDVSEETNPIKWLDNDRIALLNSDARGIRQVVRIDLRSHKVEYLTRHPTQVASFAVTPDGSVLYSAQAQLATTPLAAMLKEGFVVDDETDAGSLIQGEVGGGTALDRFWNTEWFVQDNHPDAIARKLNVNGAGADPYYLHQILFSPDGSAALISASPPSIPSEWPAYTSEYLQAVIGEAARDRRAVLPRGLQYHYIVDMRSSHIRPLWSAPTLGSLTEAAWSADGRHVLLAPTYFPASNVSARASEGNGVAVVDVETGHYNPLPVELRWRPLGPRTSVSLLWPANDHVVIVERDKSSCRRVDVKHRRAKWNAVSPSSSCHNESRSVRIEVRQDLMTPPRVFAVDRRTGISRMILDPNPGLTERFELGNVEHISGEFDDGEIWEGLLFYPVGYKSGVRYPLVIQSVYGGIQEDFTLYGTGTLGPPLIAAYPGRILASLGIAVLHMDVKPRLSTEQASSLGEGERRTRAFQAAITKLTDSGLVDVTKIGLAGFSRNGYFVEYALTHSDFRYAAALAADNFDPSYFPTILVGDISSSAAVNGSPPTGEGLKRWLSMAPGFNIDKIQTPLRLVEQSHGLFGILQRWEFLLLSRYLAKPVELYVIPDAASGAHNTQNPGQIVAIQEGSVDWFSFWLQNVQDSAVSKAQQYRRWKRLRDLSVSASAPSHRTDSELSNQSKLK